MNICIIQTAFLGDLILTASLIESINKKYNFNTNITLIVKKGLENTFSKKFLSTHNIKIEAIDKKNKDKSIFATIRFAKKFKNINLDLCLCIHRSIRSAIISYFINAKEKIGFKENPLSIIFNKSVDRNGTHEIYKNHNLLISYDNSFINFIPDYINPYNLLEDRIIDTSYKPFILIAPGSIWNTKRFTIEGFTKICKYILENYNYNIIFTGTKDDESYINTIIKIINSEKITNLCNKLSIQELTTYIKNAKLAITNDSGPLHIAVGTNTNLICFFGPTTRSLGYYPLSEKAYIFENSTLKCRPCGTHGHKKCPLKNSPHTCMKSIEINLIYKKIDEFLSNS